MELTQKDIDDLKREGYSEAEIMGALNEIKAEESFGITTQRTDPRMFAHNSAFAPQNQDNLIKWQLELDNILERAEHILRGDKLVFESGNLIWKENQDPQDNILNEYGVQEVMRVLSMYLNRNTILSDYEDKEIKYKVLDFGRELNDLFFMKYEELGLAVTLEEAFQRMFKTKAKLIFSESGIKAEIESGDLIQQLELTREQIHEVEIYRRQLALEKRKNYPMLHREMIDMVHSAYKRALHGGEKRSLREARHITQAENLANQGGGVTINTQSGQPSTRGILNPLRYLSSPYK